MAQEELKFTAEVLDTIAEALPDGVTDADILALFLSILTFYQVDPQHALQIFRVGGQIVEHGEYTGEPYGK